MHGYVFCSAEMFPKEKNIVGYLQFISFYCHIRMHLEEWRQRCRSHTGAENLERKLRGHSAKAGQGSGISRVPTMPVLWQPRVHKVKQHRLRVSRYCSR